MLDHLIFSLVSRLILRPIFKYGKTWTNAAIIFLAIIEIKTAGVFCWPSSPAKSHTLFPTWKLYIQVLGPLEHSRKFFREIDRSHRILTFIMSTTSQCHNVHNLRVGACCSTTGPKSHDDFSLLIFGDYSSQDMEDDPLVFPHSFILVVRPTHFVLDLFDNDLALAVKSVPFARNQRQGSHNFTSPFLLVLVMGVRRHSRLKSKHE